MHIMEFLLKEGGKNNYAADHGTSARALIFQKTFFTFTHDTKASEL